MEATWWSRVRPTVIAALRGALAGEAPLRDGLRHYVGLEDDRGVPTEPADGLACPSLLLYLVEELDGDLDRAAAAAVALELVHQAMRLRSEAGTGERQSCEPAAPPVPWDAPQSITAGDLLMALALCEARRTGDAVFSLILAAAIEAIDARAASIDSPASTSPLAVLLGCAAEAAGIVAGASREVWGRLESAGRAIGRTMDHEGKPAEDAVAAATSAIERLPVGRSTIDGLLAWWTMLRQDSSAGGGR